MSGGVLLCRSGSRDLMSTWMGFYSVGRWSGSGQAPWVGLTPRCAVSQALKSSSWVGSYSVDRPVRLLKRHLWEGSFSANGQVGSKGVSQVGSYCVVLWV